MIFIVYFFCKKGFLKIEKKFNSWTILLNKVDTNKISKKT